MIYQPWILASLFFFVTVSKTVKAIPLVLSIIIILSDKNFIKYFKEIRHKQWFFSIIAILILAALAMTHGIAPFSKKLSSFTSYLKLIYIPIFAIGFRNHTYKQFAINGYLAGMALTAILSIFLFYKGLPHFDEIFYNHIVTSAMMSFAVILSIHNAALYGNKFRLIYSFLAILYSYQLFFINTGRTGQILLLVMLLIFMLINFYENQSMNKLSILAIVLVIILSFCYNSSAKLGLSSAINNIATYGKDQNTSVGFRIQFHEYARSLFLKHPIIGNGLSSFSENFYRDNPVPKFGRIINEPHSTYWLFATEMGVFSVIVLVLFFISLFIDIWKSQTYRAPASAFLIAFALVNFSDTLLFSKFFILFMGLFLA